MHRYDGDSLFFERGDLKFNLYYFEIREEASQLLLSKKIRV